MTNIVKIDPKEFGLEEQKAAQIEAQFKPMLEKMTELEAEFNEVVKLPIEQPETATKAKELRLKYVKVRTGTAEIHKTQKAFYLAGGRFVDGWKNAQEFASQGIEKRLMDIEKYQENLEKEKQAQLEAERTALIQPFTDILPVGLGTMQKEVFDNYLQGLKLAHQARLDAEKKAEEERLRLIEETNLHNSRKESLLNVWNYLTDESKQLNLGQLSQEHFTKLQEVATANKAAHEAEQERIKTENERLEKERLAAEKKAADERAKAEAERKKLAEETERKLAEERKKQADLQAQLKAKQDAEIARLEAEKKAEQERIEAEKKAALAPDKDKILGWINSMDVAVCEVNSAQAKATVTVIQQKFEAFKNWAISQTANL